MKEKAKKTKWVTVQGMVGSLIITPKEIEAFKKSGIDLLVALKEIQKKIYKNPNKKNPAIL